MAWTELTNLRKQRSRTYQDNEKPSHRVWSGTLAPLHYESQIDSGIYNAEIDMTPQRIDNPQFDGWRVTANGWHYALGKDLANHGNQDGWVGFGGRRGAHWFKFRLLRVGYLHWPTRTWDDVGGPPTYDRTNLSHQTNILTIGPNDDQIPLQTVATWSGIWATPSGGDLSTRWSANPDRLKEEIVINQASRQRIASNTPPATPLDKTWFGLLFRLDWSGIPRIYRADILQDPDADWSDDGEQIQLKDALNRLLAFIPLGDVRVPLKEDDDVQPVQKRFWSEGGNHYLFVGVRCDVLNAMAAGDLVFDPTINLEIAAGNDDAHEQGDGTFDTTGDEIKLYSNTDDTSVDYRCGGFRWDNVTVPNSATIDAATIALYFKAASYDMANHVIYFHDADDPSDFVDDATLIARTRTTANVSYVEIDITLPSWKTSDSIVSIIEEITTRGGWASGQAMVALLIGNTDFNDKGRCEAYEDAGTANNAKLDIEYTIANANIITMII